MKKPIVKKINIKLIKPYWRNPRNNKEAIEKVKSSIRDYGYNQFISVDEHDVIVTGHTRWQALLDLGFGEIDVIVLDLDPQKAKKYRIIDNKTNEFAEWTDDLYLELREMDDLGLLQEYFSEDVNDEIAKLMGKYDVQGVSQEEIDKKQELLRGRLKGLADSAEDDLIDVICPDCSNEFSIRLSKKNVSAKLKENVSNISPETKA